MLHFVVPYNNRYILYHNYDILTWNLVERSIIKLQYGLKKYILIEDHKKNDIFMDLDQLYFLEE